MRGEVLHVLSTHGITLDDLLYVDDIFHWIGANSLSAASVFLVDHNEPCLAWHRSPLVGIDQVSVVGILDHHQDAGKCTMAAPRIVEACASCSSLLITRFNARHELLWWPLVWDSMNFTFRTTELDLAARDALCSQGALMDSQQVFSQLEAAADSVPEHSLPLPLLLLKDYKLFCTANALLYYGMSTVHISLDSLPPEGLQEAIERTLDLECLHLLVICSAYRSADVRASPGDYSFRQQVLFACPVDSSHPSMALTEELPLWMSKEADLCFTRLSLGSPSHQRLSWSAWQQGRATNAGRKQLQPLISRFLSRRL